MVEPYVHAGEETRNAINFSLHRAIAENSAHNGVCEGFFFFFFFLLTQTYIPSASMHAPVRTMETFICMCVCVCTLPDVVDASFLAFDFFPTFCT